MDVSITEKRKRKERGGGNVLCFVLRAEERWFVAEERSFDYHIYMYIMLALNSEGTSSK